MSSCQDGGADNQSRQQNNAVNWVRLSAKTIGDCRHIAALTVHYSLPSQMGILLAIWQPNFPSIQWFDCVDVAIGKWTFPLNFKTISTLERAAVRANVSMFSLWDHLNQSEELFPKASPNAALVWQIDSYDVYLSPSYELTHKWGIVCFKVPLRCWWNELVKWTYCAFGWKPWLREILLQRLGEDKRLVCLACGEPLVTSPVISHIFILAVAKGIDFWSPRLLASQGFTEMHWRFRRSGMDRHKCEGKEDKERVARQGKWEWTLDYTLSKTFSSSVSLSMSLCCPTAKLIQKVLMECSSRGGWLREWPWLIEQSYRVWW